MVTDFMAFVVEPKYAAPVPISHMYQPAEEGLRA
jgi:hypothetical protein